MLNVLSYDKYNKIYGFFILGFKVDLDLIDISVCVVCIEYWCLIIDWVCVVIRIILKICIM